MTTTTLSLPIARLTVLDDPRLGAEGWSVTMDAADTANFVEAVTFGRSLRPAAIENLAVDLLILEVLNTLRLDNLVWEFNVEPNPELPDAVASQAPRHGPVSGMTAQLERLDGTQEVIGVWVRWGNKASQSAMNAPEAVLPAIADAIRLGGAPRQFALGPR